MKPKNVGVWEAEEYTDVICKYAIYKRGQVRCFCYAVDKESAEKIVKMLNKLEKIERKHLKNKI